MSDTSTLLIDGYARVDASNSPDKSLMRLMNELEADDRQFVMRFVETFVLEQQQGRKRSIRKA